VPTKKEREFFMTDCTNFMEQLGEIVKSKSGTKHYLGDPKWVLYQYICDMQSKIPLPYNVDGRQIIGHGRSIIRCGVYAFDKISRMSGFAKYPEFEPLEPGVTKLTDEFDDLGMLNLNGEYMYVFKFRKYDKRQVIISPWTNFKLAECIPHIERLTESNIDDVLRIYPDDIVLYFA
jgi:hypothetical protein